MNRISRTRPGAWALMLVLALGAAACDGQQGCGPQQVEEEAKKAPELVCGAGTFLQGGQCIATTPVKTQ